MDVLRVRNRATGLIHNSMHVEALLDIVIGGKAGLHPFEVEKSRTVNKLIDHPGRDGLRQAVRQSPDRSHGTGPSTPAD